MFSACYLSSVAVLRSVVGAESVKLRQAVRRSSYISICIHRYSVAFATFFNLLCINCITLFTLCIISILLFSYLYQNNAVITISSGYYCILSLHFIYLYQAIEIPLYNYILNHCTITYNTIVPLYRVQSYDCITNYLPIVSTDCINLSFI